MERRTYDLLLEKIDDLKEDIAGVKDDVSQVKSDLGHYKGFMAGVVFVFTLVWSGVTYFLSQWSGKA